MHPAERSVMPIRWCGRAREARRSPDGRDGGLDGAMSAPSWRSARWTSRCRAPWVG